MTPLTLSAAIARLETAQVADRIQLRESVLDSGPVCIKPLVAAVGRRPDLCASVAAWLVELVRRDPSCVKAVVAALGELQAFPLGRHASDAIDRLGVGQSSIRARPVRARCRASRGRVDRVEVHVLRVMTPEQVRRSVDEFAPPYAADWAVWLDAPPSRRPGEFRRLLGKWQATRGTGPLRKFRRERAHPPPFLDDLLDEAAGPLAAVSDLYVGSIRQRTLAQETALRDLWRIFGGLAVGKPATCVGITKAVLLLTDGRIGPALDSTVQAQIGLRPEDDSDWIAILQAIGDDIADFESAHGELSRHVGAQFAHLSTGRLYDMAVGPRGRT